MNIKQRLKRVEQSLPPDFSRLSDGELIEYAQQILMPATISKMKALAATVTDVLPYTPGMNLGAVTDAQLCAMLFERAR